MGDLVEVTLPPLVPGQAESWAALIELAESFGEDWMLVGGQLVFLLEVERGSTTGRPTTDVDVVVNVRSARRGLGHVHRVLTEAGFEQQQPSAEGVAHRFIRDEAVIDVLAPDNVGGRANLKLGFGRTIAVPGATQALARVGLVGVSIGDRRSVIRRPDLIGALVAKASAALKITSQTAAERERHLIDLDTLARMVGPRDRESAALTKSERRLLRVPEAYELSPLARASLRLLVGEQPDGWSTPT